MTWPIAKLGEVADVKTGPFGSLLHQHDYVAGGVPLVNPMHIVDGRIVTDDRHAIAPEKARELANYRMAEGDVVLGRRGEMGRCAVVRGADHGSLCGTGSLIIRPGPLLSSKYLRLLLSSQDMVRTMERASLGTTMPNLNQTIVANLPVRLPPLDEQRRIAAILDGADVVCAMQSDVLRQFDALVPSIFRNMFNPADFTRATIGSFAEVRTGSTPSREDPENYGGQIPWVKTAEVDGIITYTSEFVTEKGFAASRLRLFPPNSVVVAMYGQGKTRGKSGILGVAAATNQACAVIAPNDRFDSVFLQAQLSMAYNELRDTAAGGNQPNLSVGRVEQFEVMLPPISLQRKFASRIALVHSKRAKKLASIEANSRLLASLQSRAFSGCL
jgi:type I restriction enzyme, S subunit